MPVGNVEIPNEVYAIKGIKVGVTAAGVRYQNRDDLVVFELAQGTNTAVVSTKNAFCAAPVRVLREHVKAADTRYLVINTGNANAGTGQEGLKRAEAVCAALGEKAGVEAAAVLPFSTGVIGETLNSDAIITGLDAALSNLDEAGWVTAANGIRTTDIVPKVASEMCTVAGTTYHVTGISKGSGMIRPNMATMLGYVATDANIEKSLLQKMLLELTEASFNRITVDGDMSTNDGCVLMATGQAASADDGGADAGRIDSEAHPHYEAVYAALKAVFVQLAQLIVRDGEGATKFITIAVTGGRDTKECCDVAYAVAHSPLVKTAFFASDPNWGRILAAVGYAGIDNPAMDLDTDCITVKLDEVVICEQGGLAASYTEAAGKEVMSRDEITIHIDLARGEASDTVYTCDLSYDYVKINADYRS